MRRVTIVAFALILVAAILRVTATYRVFSATNDEPVHVAAGLEWLDRGTYQLDREHPPLSRILFALGPRLGGAQLSAGENRIEQGNDVLYRGEYRRNLSIVRAGNLPFFLLALVVIALWARRLFGDATAILSLAFGASLPPILAHAGLATTDMSVAALTITALYALALWLERPSWPRAVFLGAAIGLGLISKMSFLVFFPAGAIFFVRRPSGQTRASVLHAIAAAAIAFFIVWGGYRFDTGTLNEVRLSTLPDYAPEYHAARYASQPGYEWVRGDILERYWSYSNNVGVKLIDFVDWAKAAGYPSPLAGRSGRDTMAGLPRVLPPGHYDRFLEPFRRTWQWIAVRAPIPAPEYLTGVKYVQLHSKHGHPAYLFGEQKETGWWYYFPVVFLFKTPIPFLILCIAGTVSLIKRGSAESLSIALGPWLMLAIAMTSRINIGVRHILPMYPLLAISAAFAAVALWQRTHVHKIAVALLLIWHFITTSMAHPDYLAWFNGAAGPRPDRIALDSNLDWGQDILRLEEMARRENLQPLYVAWFGSARREAMSVRAEELPGGACRAGWVAVSEMRYHSDKALHWVHQYEPMRRVGKSIRLYKIDTCPESVRQP